MPFSNVNLGDGWRRTGFHAHGVELDGAKNHSPLQGVWNSCDTCIVYGTRWWVSPSLWIIAGPRSMCVVSVHHYATNNDVVTVTFCTNESHYLEDAVQKKQGNLISPIWPQFVAWQTTQSVAVRHSEISRVWQADRIWWCTSHFLSLCHHFLAYTKFTPRKSEPVSFYSFCTICNSHVCYGSTPVPSTARPL